MTSWHGTTFRITGPLWWESTGGRWIPVTNGQWCWTLMISPLLDVHHIQFIPSHYGVMTRYHFPHHWSFVKTTHQGPADSRYTKAMQIQSSLSNLETISMSRTLQDFTVIGNLRNNLRQIWANMGFAETFHIAPTSQLTEQPNISTDSVSCRLYLHVNNWWWIDWILPLCAPKHQIGIHMRFGYIKSVMLVLTDDMAYLGASRPIGFVPTTHVKWVPINKFGNNEKKTTHVGFHCDEWVSFVTHQYAMQIFQCRYFSAVTLVLRRPQSPVTRLFV